MISKRLLRRLSVRQLREAIRQKSSLERVEAVERERSGLLRKIAKLDRKLARLGKTGAAPKGRRRRRWKLSAATRRKMAAAAKRRWAGLRASKSSSKS